MINQSVFVFAGEPVIIPEDVNLIIDCSPLIDAFAAQIGYVPTVRWYKNETIIRTGCPINIKISDDGRLLTITGTELGSGSQLVAYNSYFCEACNRPTECLINDTNTGRCGE